MATSFSVQYLFELVDKFTPAAAGIAVAAARMGKAIAAAGATMGPLIARLAGVTAGVVLLSGAFALMGVKKAAAFEESLTSLRRVTGITRDEMFAYGKDAMQLGVSVGKSGEQIAEMMTEGALMGIRGRETLAAFAETVAKVSVTWDDMGEKMASRSLATLTAQWFNDLAPEDARKRLKETADTINELSNRSAFKAPELLKAFERGGVAAKKFGLTPEQFSAYAGTALVTGEKSGELQGTRARMTFTKLTRNLAAPTKGFNRALGLLKTSRDQMGKMLLDNPQDLMLDVMERMQGMNKIQQESVAAGLLDSRSAAQFSAVAANINEYKKQLAIADDQYANRFAKDTAFMNWLRNGDQGLREIAEQLERYNKVVTRSGSVDREFGRRTESLTFALKQLGHAWDRLQILAALPLLDPLRKGTNILTDFVSAMGDLSQYSAIGGTLLTAGLGAGLISLGLVAAAFAARMVGLTGALARFRSVVMLTGMAWKTLMTMAALSSAVALTLVVTAIGVTSAMWIYDNWGKLAEYASTPISFSVLFPELPPWIKAWMDFTAEQNAASTPGTGAHKKGWTGLSDWFAGLGGGKATPPSMYSAPDPNSAWYDRMNQRINGLVSGFPAGPALPPPAPAPNPNRVPQAAAERIKVESQIRGEIAPLQVTATPITVNVRGTVNGPVAGSGSGTLTTNAPRGVSTAEAGQAAVSP